MNRINKHPDAHSPRVVTTVYRTAISCICLCDVQL